VEAESRTLAVTDHSQLRIEDVSKQFGGVQALNRVSLEVRKGEILSVIGPNGAGKTTLVNCVNGVFHPERGKIFLDGHEITHQPPHRIAKLGIARTFQNIALFRGMTVLDNLMLGRHVRMKSGAFRSVLYWGPGRREEVEHRKVAEDIIDFLEIEAIRKQVVGALPFGLQKRVELGRALALGPKLLLLDEPMAGLNLEEVEDMARFILDINEEARWRATCVLVEHDMGVVMDISHRVAVLNFGEKIAEGTPAAIQAEPQVHQAYLGEEEGEYVSRR